LALRGKTGTTDGARDAWFVGYTPELLVAVWVGYDRPQSLRTARGDESGGSLAAPIAESIFASTCTMTQCATWTPIASTPPTFSDVFTSDAPATVRMMFPDTHREEEGRE
ncbi:MAG: hypothetical protein Q7S02_05210, partial [bacterium]|nr:hypothetical protein [bacterium]